MAAKKKKKAIIGRPREKRRGSPFDKALGLRIKEMQVAKRMTDEVLAEAIGRGVWQVYRYKAGDTIVDTHALARLCIAFNCTASDLMDGLPVPK